MAAPTVPSKHTRTEFREYLVGKTLREISDLFDGADVPCGVARTPIGGQRRGLVEDYYAGVNWNDAGDVAKVLSVYERVLNDLDDEIAHPNRDESVRRDTQQCRAKLVNLLKRDGFAYEDRRLRRAVGVDLRALANGSVADVAGLGDHIRRIEQSIDSDPALTIGSAKELVETVAKAVLVQYGETDADCDTLPRLVKKALKCLDLSLESIPEAKKGAKSIRMVLASLSQIVAGVAELRNAYGTGHGRTRSGGLQPRHARLTVGAAATLTRFLLDTLDERRSARSSAKEA